MTTISQLNSLPANKSCPLCDDPAHIKPSEKSLLKLVWCRRCGYFEISDDALIGFEHDRHLLAGLTKRASLPEPRVETRLMLTSDSVPTLLSDSGLPRDPLDKLDVMLEYAKDHQQKIEEFIEYGPQVATDYPLVFARSPEEFLYLFRMLSEQGLLDEPLGRDPARRTSFRITPEGWKRLRELAKTGRDTNRAFVAMSFAPELLPAWEKGIKLALEDLGFMPTRIDQTHGEDKIDDRIIAEIRKSGLLVADFTGHRAGVYFEAGFAMGLGIPVVWTCKREDEQQAHFDTRQQQHLLWETPEELREKLTNHIAARIAGHSLP